MATPLQRMMNEPNAAAGNACRVLVDSCHEPNSPLAYFFSITVPQPKIRIKIPKVLAKSIQRRRRRDDQCGENECKRGDARKKLFAKRVGLFCSKVFCGKKREETCSPNVRGDGRVCSNGGLIGGSGDGVNGEGKHSRDIAEVALPKLKNFPGLGKEGHLRLNSLFDKKHANSFVRGNSRRTDTSAKGVTATDCVIGKLERSPTSARYPARTPTARQKSETDRSRGKNLIRLFAEEGKREWRADEELCKKRILMGEKCRPLHHSGTLKYDKDGTLLPETIA